MVTKKNSSLHLFIILFLLRVFILIFGSFGPPYFQLLSQHLSRTLRTMNPQVYCSLYLTWNQTSQVSAIKLTNQGLKCLGYSVARNTSHKMSHLQLQLKVSSDICYLTPALVATSRFI